MSTLRPGKTDQAIRDLQEAAEKDARPASIEKKQVQPTFDQNHQANVQRDLDTDDNWVSRYPGQNSEHIGNGSGGVK